MQENRYFSVEKITTDTNLKKEREKKKKYFGQERENVQTFHQQCERGGGIFSCCS